jgi:hypothetical protein
MWEYQEKGVCVQQCHQEKGAILDNGPLLSQGKEVLWLVIIDREIPS